MSEAHEMVVIIRPSFMKFCQDGCRAAAFNHALYRLSRKAKGETREKIQGGEVMWYATTEEFTEALANAWGVCKVRQEVNQLISMGLLGRGRNPAWGADRTKHFFFGSEQCKKLLHLSKEHTICLLHIGLTDDMLHLIKSSNAPSSELKCTCKQIIILSDASIKPSDALIKVSNQSDKSIEAITEMSSKVTTKITNQEKEREQPAPQQEEHNPSFTLSNNGLSFADLYESQTYTIKPKKRTEKVIEQYEELAKLIHSESELLRLFEIAREQNAGKKDQRIWLGNLVNALPAYQQEQMGKKDAWYADPPEPTETKPDGWIDELVRELAKDWHEAELLDNLISEVKAIYQRAGDISDAGFEMAAREMLDAMGDMDVSEARKEGKASLSAYFVWLLKSDFNQPARR